MTKGDTSARRRLSLAFPVDMYENLREEALKHRVSIADVIRQKIVRFNSPIINESPSAPVKVEIAKQDEEAKIAVTELLFLLREFLFERNAQILKKVDEKMDRQFGKERTKIL